MGNWNMMNFNNYGGAWGPFWSFMPLLLVWSLFWKGLALWKSARNDQRYWFFALLIVNTAGILDLLYLFVFAKDKFVFVSEPKKVSRPVAHKTSKK